MIECWYCGSRYDTEPEVYDSGFNIYRCPHCGERDAIPTHASGYDIDKILRIKYATRLILDAFYENEKISIEDFSCASSSAEELRELSWRNMESQNKFSPEVFIKVLKD